MCWRIEKHKYFNNPEKYHKIADKDIFVYKYGNVSEEDNCFHPCIKEHFAYKPNVLNKEIKLNLEENENSILMIYVYHIIEEGYHSYSGECGIINSFYDIGVYSKNDNEKNLDFYRCEDIGKFIIPKDSEYYENEDGEIVSSNIIWTGEYHLISNIKCDIKAQFKDLKYVLDDK